MLRDVLRFDLVLNAKALLLNGLIFSVFLVFMAHNGEIPIGEYAVVGALMFSFSNLTVLTREDRFKTAILLCSLPVKRRTIVLGRYVLAALSGLVGIAYASLLTLLPTAQVLTEGTSVLSVVGPATVAIVLGNSLLMPFTIRFGFIGVMVFLVAGQVLGIAVLAIWRRVQGAAELKDVIARGIGSVRDLQQSTDPWVFGVGVAILLLIGLVVSCWISARVFERKAL